MAEREGRSTWPSHRVEERAWSQGIRGGTRADRTLSKIEVSLPPLIGEEPIVLSGELARDVERSMSEITALDRSHGVVLEPLVSMLLRSESVASSKIERIQADIDDYARALHGSRANASARSMVAATDALAVMMDGVTRSEAIDVTTLTGPHRALMIDDPLEADQAGRLRTVQNWIGGSDHSPRGALYVPPPADTVAAYLSDLVAFANRDDMPALVQAAIAHAQFESIHPFTDGNGRIGRALVNAILRLRGATRHVVVPLASSFVAHRDRYFDALTDYRRGDPIPIVAAFARGARIAAAESSVTAVRLGEAPGEMRAMLGPVRAGSAALVLLDLLPSHPILSAEEAIEATGRSASSVYDALDRMTEAGVLRPLTGRTRNQVWGATLILDELDDLGRRIEAASR